MLHGLLHQLPQHPHLPILLVLVVLEAAAQLLQLLQQLLPAQNNLLEDGHGVALAAPAWAVTRRRGVAAGERENGLRGRRQVVDLLDVLEQAVAVVGRQLADGEVVRGGGRRGGGGGADGVQG